MNVQLRKNLNYIFSWIYELISIQLLLKFFKIILRMARRGEGPTKNRKQRCERRKSSGEDAIEMAQKKIWKSIHILKAQGIKMWYHVRKRLVVTCCKHGFIKH